MIIEVIITDLHANVDDGMMDHVHYKKAVEIPEDFSPHLRRASVRALMGAVEIVSAHIQAGTYGLFELAMRDGPLTDEEIEQLTAAVIT